MEKGTLPDGVLCLQDPSDNGDFLVKRWYQLNRGDIDQHISVRKQKEAEEKRLKEEMER